MVVVGLITCERVVLAKSAKVLISESAAEGERSNTHLRKKKMPGRWAGGTSNVPSESRLVVVEPSHLIRYAVSSRTQGDFYLLSGPYHVHLFFWKS